MGRDSHLLKEFLIQATPCQILYGMYCFEGNKTITIPMFLKVQNTWLEMDVEAAEIELATLITKKVPPAYYVWKELRQEQDAASWKLYNEARIEIRNWAERIVV